jgi:hypothetical protein
MSALFLVTFAPGPGWEPGRPRRAQDRWDEHAAFMDYLLDAGIVLIGGPVGESVDEGPAVILVAAPDAVAAASVFDHDPWLDDMLAIERVERWTLWLGTPP